MLRLKGEPLCQTSLAKLKSHIRGSIHYMEQLSLVDLFHNWESHVSAENLQKIKNFFWKLLHKVRDALIKNICNRLLQGAILDQTEHYMLLFVEHFDMIKKHSPQAKETALSVSSYADILDRRNNQNNKFNEGIRSAMLEWLVNSLHRYCTRHGILSPRPSLTATPLVMRALETTITRFLATEFGTPDDSIFKFLLDNPDFVLLNEEKQTRSRGYGYYSNQQIDVNFPISTNVEYVHSRHKKIKRPILAPESNKLAREYEIAVSSTLLPMTVHMYCKNNPNDDGSSPLPWAKNEHKRQKIFEVASRLAGVPYMRPIMDAIFNLVNMGKITSDNLSKWTVSNILGHIKTVTAKLRERIKQIDNHTLRIAMSVMEYRCNRHDNTAAFIVDERTEIPVAAFMFNCHSFYLRHCLGSNGSNNTGYAPAISFDEIANINDIWGLRRAKFKNIKQGIMGAYLNNVFIKRNTKIICFHDSTEGVPVGTAELIENGISGEMKLTQLRGYRNGPISPDYKKGITKLLLKFAEKYCITGFSLIELKLSGIELAEIKTA